MTLQQLCQMIQDTNFGTAIRESVWWFPIIEGTHLLCLAISVGMIMCLDLRLTGIAFKKIPVSRVSDTVMPLALAGFVIMFVTGILLFWAQAAKAYDSVYFRIKVVLLLLAGINAIAFELGMRKSITKWESDMTPPTRARFAGFASLILWAGVIAAGRTMAYHF
jgi:uncharacterized membrane protein SirB2